MAGHQYAGLCFEDILADTTPLSETFDPPNYPDHQSAPIDHALHYDPPYPFILGAHDAVAFQPSPALNCLRASSFAMMAAETPGQSQANTDYDNVINDFLDGTTEYIPTDPENSDRHPSSPISNQQSFLLSDTNNNNQSSLLSNANNNNQAIKPAALRTTCEGCRKLKIRCLPSVNGQSCQKCSKKGAPCVFEPRAPYTTRTKKQ